jgi:hypothetical protein
MRPFAQGSAAVAAGIPGGAELDLVELAQADADRLGKLVKAVAHGDFLSV